MKLDQGSLKQKRFHIVRDKLGAGEDSRMPVALENSQFSIRKRRAQLFNSSLVGRLGLAAHEEKTSVP
jgi:hypothetical protein